MDRDARPNRIGVPSPRIRRAPRLYDAALASGFRLSRIGCDAGWDEVAKAIEGGVGACHAHAPGSRGHRGRAMHAGRPITPTTDADIMITDDPSVALAVQTADCVPLLVADSSTGSVAAARRLAWDCASSPSVTVAALVEQFGSRASGLVAAIGPSIGSCCYEVGTDVRQRFESWGFSSRALERWFLVESVESATNPRLSGLSKRAREGHWFFDIWTATRDLLMEAGIPPGQVFTAQLCTASHADAFCSCRQRRISRRADGGRHPKH